MKFVEDFVFHLLGIRLSKREVPGFWLKTTGAMIRASRNK